jgi:predicted AlkP superfamily pyrophosphatase or phosphodiesterase
MKYSPLAFFLFLSALPLAAQPPKATVVIVIDQCSEHLFERHKHYFSGGIKTLLDSGSYFSHAFYPHAQPETATGHAALSTGAYGKDHGLVANEWLDDACNKINACDEPDKNKGRVFASTDKKGKSARSLKAPTLASSCIKAQNPAAVITMALKSRAAIPLAGPDGLALWFDTKNGIFTSSTAFCPRLPGWVRGFNRYLGESLHTQETTLWNPVFPAGHAAYQHAHSSYDYAGNPFSLIEGPQPFFNKEKNTKVYNLLEQTPQASLLLVRLARLALLQHYKNNPEQPIVLMLSLSNLDYSGHYYGPYSKETIDILFAIDKQLSILIDEVNNRYGEENTLWALTADHGALPIPELLAARGGIPAKRLDALMIMKELNRLVYEFFNVKELFIKSLPPHYYMDMSKWHDIDDQTQQKIITTVTDYLHAVDGVEHAWYKDEITHPSFKKQYSIGSRELWFEQQYYEGRSGDFIVQVKPYVQITNYPKGTGHDAPYDYNIRVPLILSQPGRIEQETYSQPVSMLQFAASMAHLLEVERPAMAQPGILPGIA